MPRYAVEVPYFPKKIEYEPEDDLRLSRSYVLLVMLQNCLMSVADVNECVKGTDNCDANSECVNNIGGFNCTCIQGYTKNNGINCTGKFGFISSEHLINQKISSKDCTTEVIRLAVMKQLKQLHRKPRKNGFNIKYCLATILDLIMLKLLLSDDYCSFRVHNMV